MVPEGLLPTLTLALVLATQRMAKRHVLIRYLPSVETLGSATVICTDKTGTLTQNRMLVTQLFLGSAIVSLADLKRKPDLASLYRLFFVVGRMRHDLKETQIDGQRRWLGDPMEAALLEMALQFVPDSAAGPRLDEIPFDADRMRLSTVYQAAEHVVVYSKGAADAVLPLCRHMLIDGKIQSLDAALQAGILRAQEAMARQGLRVLAFAFRELAAGYDRERLEEDLVFAGLVALEDPPQAGSSGSHPQVPGSRDTSDHGHRRPPPDCGSDRPSSWADPHR
jgi:sodium/potassium-transporting ATPase subunit alpha